MISVSIIQKRLRLTLICVLACAAMSVSVRAAVAGDGTVWTSRLGTSNLAVPWGGTVRTPNHYKLGFGLLSHDDVASIPGIEDFLESLVKLPPTHTDVILGIGPDAAMFGVGKDGTAIYRALILRDGGKEWKQRVKGAALRVHNALGASGHIYWQVGNEINAQRTLRQFDSPGKLVHKNHQVAIASYVEWVLAPIAEALLESRAEMSTASYARMSIMLGTIAGGGNPDSLLWLDSMMSYQIKGQFASTLSGKAVHEIVDVVGIHYLLSKSNQDWDAQLTSLFNRWVRSGKLDAIFHTEEVGRRYAEAGLGGSAAMRALGRYLYWCDREKVSSKQSRMLPWILWRVKDKNNVNQMMTRVYRFLGDNALDVTAQWVGRLEAYRLATKDGSKVLGIVVNTQKGAASIQRISLSAGRAAVPRCTVLAPRSVAEVPCTNGADGTIKLGRSIKLLDDGVLLIQAS